MDDENKITPWWKFGNPLHNINIDKILDEVWTAVVLGDTKWNPDRSVDDLVEEYKKSGRSTDLSVQNFIEWQTAKAGAVGFILGAPGVLAGVAIPADFAACIYLQMRAVAVIASLCGWDVRTSDRVKTVALWSMVGGNFSAGFASGGAAFGSKFAGANLKSLPASALISINKKLGFRFATKYGSQGIINLVDFIPIVGGVVSGSLNALFTYTAGCAAYRVLKHGPDYEYVIDEDGNILEPT